MGIFDKFKKNGNKISGVLDLERLGNEVPFFDDSFRKRVERCWAQFVNEESKIRALIDQRADGETVAAELGRLLSPAFAETFAEIGFNGRKYDLILNLEGNWARLFSRAYFKAHAPREVLTHWNILLGRQSNPSVDQLGLVLGGNRIEAKDIRIWTAWEGKSVKLSIYCENMLPLIRDDENSAYAITYILLDQAVGELAEMKYISDIAFLTAPSNGTSLTLGELLSDFVSHLSLTPQQLCDEKTYLDSFSVYRMQPDEDVADGLRKDVYTGSTNYLPLLNDFWNGRTTTIDQLAKDGITAGYIYFSVDFAKTPELGAKILDLRDSVVAKLEEAAPDAFRFIGGATGTHYVYIDFLAYDLKDTLLGVVSHTLDLFEKAGITWAGYHPFLLDGKTVTLFEE